MSPIRPMILIPLTAVVIACGTSLAGSVDPFVCPLTIVDGEGFTPPHPYPAQPPPLYDALWYGSDELWTKVNPAGEVWVGLPGGGQKTFWWSESFEGGGVEPSPSITVTGRRLDGPGEFTSERATNGWRSDIGSFMLVGVEFPGPGCWELIAHYEGAELGVVVQVGSD